MHVAAHRNNVWPQCSGRLYSQTLGGSRVSCGWQCERDFLQKTFARNRNLTFTPAVDGLLTTGHSLQPLSFWPSDSRTSKMPPSDWPHRLLRDHKLVVPLVAGIGRNSHFAVQLGHWKKRLVARIPIVVLWVSEKIKVDWKNGSMLEAEVEVIQQDECYKKRRRKTETREVELKMKESESG